MIRGDFSEKQKGTRAKEKKKYHKTFFSFVTIRIAKLIIGSGIPI